MFRKATRSTVVSAAGSIVMSLAIAGNAMAATWSSAVSISTSADGYLSPGELLTIGNTALVAYPKSHPTTYVQHIELRRSTDGGLNWGNPVEISRTGDYFVEEPHVAGLGNAADVTWTEWDQSTDKSVIRYTRSLDGGASFAPSVAISPAAMNRSSSVARGPNGRVAISWYNDANQRTFIRTSTDGGATFGAAQILWSSVIAQATAVAIGDGVIYAAYLNSSGTQGGIRVRRSLDDGVTWSDTKRLAGSRAKFGPFNLTAEGSDVYVGFREKFSDSGVALYRHSNDKGETWSATAQVDSPAYHLEGLRLSLQNGVVRATYSRCKEYLCDQRVYYRESLDGTSWSPRERVTTASWGYTQTFGVGFTDRIVIAYYRYSHGQHLEVRTGTY